MPIKFEWELICEAHKNDTARAKVFGGWIVRSLTYPDDRVSESMVFVSDPNHEWEVEK